MKTKIALFLPAAAALALFAAGITRAADDPPIDAETKARIDKFEQGPATVDVSKYPQGIQDNYDTFSQKCTQCHKLSRPINSDYASPDEWSRYVKRMMHKPGSGIDATDGKKIYEFLVYDSSVRKKAMLDDKLSKLSATDKAAEDAKVKEVHDKYDNK
jgi:cytochrome c5